MKTFEKMQCSVMALAFCLSATAIASIDTEQSVLNMKVKNDGIYRITYADILAMNIDLSGVQSSEIAIYNHGERVPVKIVSSNQSTFEPGSYIEFVGFSDDNLYQQGSVYSLSLALGLSVEEKNSSYDENLAPQIFYRQTDNYNANNQYSFGAPIADPWFDQRIVAIGAPAQVDMTFAVDNLVAEGTVNLALNIWGGTDYLQSPDHHVIYSLNGNTLDDFWFDGVTADIRNYSINANTLVNGTQQITIALPQDTNTIADVIHVDSWQVSYPRAFVLHDKKLDFPSQQPSNSQNVDTVFANGFEPMLMNYQLHNATAEDYAIYQVLNNGQVYSYAPVAAGECGPTPRHSCQLKFATQATDGQVFVAAHSQLLKPELQLPTLLTDIKQLGQVDYLIISHPDFIGASLDNFVQAKSLDYAVGVVDVEQIYAQFGFHNVSADSIASYIHYAKNHFGVSNVLLIGGDSYDYKNYLGLNSISFIPSLYVQTDDLITFAQADAKYADTNNDNIPDINIGRFPVRTVAELDNLIQKIQDYSSKSYAMTSLFAADKFDSSTGYSFKNDAQELIAILPQQWQDNISLDNKAYLDDEGVNAVKAKIGNNINQGVALTSFIGHSGTRDWSFSRMFSASDALLLSNLTHPTLVTQWGCWNTYYVSPQEDTMAHAFMLNQNGGAASVLGASTLTKAEHEKGLAHLVLSNLTQGQMSLGDAVTQAKITYAQTNPQALDVILGWNILGDPGLKL